MAPTCPARRRSCSTTALSSTTTTPASRSHEPSGPASSGIRYEWRAPFANHDVNTLHAEGFAHPVLDIDWRAQVEGHSLGWVCATNSDGRLVGFVNVAWDGGVHAFVLDTLVEDTLRRRGIGRGLLEVAVRESGAAGCEWLHVDFEEELRGFYLESCRFTSTPAGLIALR